MTSTRSLWIQVLLIAENILICVFPFYWMVTTSLKTQVVALEAPPVLSRPWTITAKPCLRTVCCGP